MRKWIVESDGVRHTVNVKKGGLHSKLVVDDEVIKLKSSSALINLVDYFIDFGEKKCHLVILGGKTDLAVDGVFLDSKKDYEPLTEIPKFVMILLAVSSIGGVIWNGIIGLCIGLIFSQFYLQAGIQKKNKNVAILFVLCTIIQFFVGIIVARLLSGQF